MREEEMLQICFRVFLMAAFVAINLGAADGQSCSGCTPEERARQRAEEEFRRRMGMPKSRERASEVTIDSVRTKRPDYDVTAGKQPDYSSPATARRPAKPLTSEGIENLKEAVIEYEKSLEDIRKGDTKQAIQRLEKTVSLAPEGSAPPKLDRFRQRLRIGRSARFKFTSCSNSIGGR